MFSGYTYRKPGSLALFYDFSLKFEVEYIIHFQLSFKKVGDCVANIKTKTTENHAHECESNQVDQICSNQCKNVLFEKIK